MPAASEMVCAPWTGAQFPFTGLAFASRCRACGHPVLACPRCPANMPYAAPICPRCFLRKVGASNSLVPIELIANVTWLAARQSAILN